MTRGESLPTSSAPGSQLGDKTYATVVLRLVLDKHGQLLYGEVVDADARPRGRFNTWEGMVKVVQAWLASQA
jgi:hypothetical protein